MSHSERHNDDQKSGRIRAGWQQRFLSELRRIVHPLTLSVWLGAAVIAGLSGPFGSYGGKEFLPLFITWLALIGAPIIIVYTVYAIWSVFGPVRESGRFYLGFIPICSLLCGAALRLILVYWVDDPMGSDPGVFRLALYMAAIMSMIVLTRSFMPGLHGAPGSDVGSDAQDADAAALDAQAAPCRLAQRLGLGRDAVIDHIAASGHFTEVFVAETCHRIRMRFSDALLELDEIAGLLTHRSHWVHRDAIQGWRSSGAKPVVVLRCGKTVPVSKTYMDDVRAADLPDLDLAQSGQDAGI